MNSLASLVDRTLVSHAPFQAAVREIETCFEFAREASEPICIALIGPSRTGKSRVLDVCERQHPKVRREDGMYVPILRVTTPSKPTVKGLAEVLLEGMGAVDTTRGTENERTRRVKCLMHNTGTRMLMIDEFQHFFDKGTKLIMHHVADWLKILVDETRCALVVAGLPSCQTVIDSNEQLAGRFHAPILMPRFSWQDVEQREEFIGILQAFHQVLSQHFQTPEFQREAMAFRFYCATGGLERFSCYCIVYPQWANQADALLAVTWARAWVRAASRLCRVRALAERSCCLIFDQACSMGLKSGE